MTRTMKSLERKWIVAYKVHEQGNVPSSTSPANLAKIGPVVVEIIGLKGIVE